MDFEKDPAVCRIRESARRGALSHALLISGSGDRMAVARYAAAAMQCQTPGEQPCGVCSACRKAFGDIHPDIITVRDESHKNLSVDVIRQIRADAYVRPNEGARKVYIVPDCAILTEQDQNVLLKIVEEGPPYAAFLFCAENGSVVLQTLRSRCVEVKLQSGRQAEQADTSENGAALCQLLLAGKRGAVAEWMVRLEKKRMDRAALAAMLEESRSLLAAALLAQYGKMPEGPGADLVRKLSRQADKTRLMRVIELLQTYRRSCEYNVGVSHVLGALAVELEEIL